MDLGELARRLRALWRRSSMTRDLDDEMELHMALRQERLSEKSGDPAASIAQARRRFGNALRVREEAMDAWGWRWLDQARQDLRFTFRTLTRHPGFTLMAVCTLALGIGANTAVFSVVNGVMLRPLPFAQADRLVQLYGTSPLSPAGGAMRDVRTYAEQSRSFEAMAAYEVSARYLSGGDMPERTMTVQAQPSFFPVLNAAPLSGRTFGPDDPATVVVLSETFWRDRLNSDPSVIGRALRLDDRDYTVIGVMPERFQFPYRAGSVLSGVGTETRTDLWMPLDPPLGPRSQIGNVIARLRPGVSATAAEAELVTIAARLAIQYPESNRGRSVRVVPLAVAVVPPIIRRPLLLLLGATGLLLVLACSNVASLWLVRLTLRGREVALRRALGAGRLRLVRQFVIESAVLALAGGLAGLGLAWWGVTSVMQLAATALPRAQDVGLDWRVFLFVLAICSIVSLGLGLPPILSFGRRDARSILQESGSTSTMGRHSRRLRDGMVVVEVALAFILAVGAAMLIREFVRLHDAPTGMATHNVVTFHVGRRMTGADKDARPFYEIADRVGRLPGVRSAGFTQLLPLQNWGWTANSSTFHLASEHHDDAAPVFPFELRYVTPDYFRALGISVRGRAFTRQDDPSSPPVAIINEALAEKSFPGRDPIGLVTTRGTIVGVIGDVRQAHLDQPAAPELYTVLAQNWSQLTELGLTLVVSTTGSPEQIIAPVRGIIREVSPNHAVFNVKTMDTVVDESLADFRLYLSVIAVAAVLAVLLALTGTYSVISHIATARTREIAIRMALGANKPRVARMIIAQGAKLAGAGLAIGVLGAMAAGQLVQGLTVSIRPPDLLTMAPTAAVIAAVAIFACLIPAQRAASGDPLRALKSD